MRRSVVFFIIFLISGVWLRSAEAKIARGGGGMQPHVQNRSEGANRGNFNSGNFNRGNVNAANVNRGNVNAANVNRGNVNAANINRGNINAANVNRGNVNAANINRGNINAANVNVDRNVNVHGGYWDYPGWGWGSFATGAAVGATSAAVGAAIANGHPQTVVVAAPPAGTVVAALPPSCAMAAGGPTLYNCDGVYYQPFYSGSSLVYQVVPAP